VKESSKNQLEDFVHVAPVVGVTHFVVLTQTLLNTYMRFMRVPHGPTLTFTLLSYSLAKDVIHMQKRPHSPGAEMNTSPLVVLNNFSGKEPEKQIMAAMFQNLFPPIDVEQVRGVGSVGEEEEMLICCAS